MSHGAAQSKAANGALASAVRTPGTPQTAEQLIERVFGAHDVAREYPLVFDARFTGSLVAVESEGEVRSTCAILARDLVVGATKLRVGLIGSVSTDERSRGRGLGTEMLDKAEHELQKQGALLAMLWADDATFYAKRGWRAFSAEHDVVVTSAIANELPRTNGARAATSADFAAIHALYSRHAERVDRTSAETSALLCVPGMRVLVNERDGVIVSYTCLGRGRDLADVVHEWGGAVDDVLALVRAHFDERRASGNDKPLYLMASRSCEALVERVDELGASSAVGVLALGKIVDLAACAALAAECFEPKGYVQASLHPARAGAVELRGPNGACSLTREDLLELLCAARGDTTLADECARTLGVERGRLPLAPFVWGLDSI